MPKDLGRRAADGFVPAAQIVCATQFRCAASARGRRGKDHLRAVHGDVLLRQQRREPSGYHVATPALAGFHAPRQLIGRHHAVDPDALGVLHEIMDLLAEGMAECSATIVILDLIHGMLGTTTHTDR